jgi:hypothetical protein
MMRVMLRNQGQNLSMRRLRTGPARTGYKLLYRIVPSSATRRAMLRGGGCS